MKTNNITSPESEANVLSNIRQDWRNLHSHPWIDDATGERRRALRKYIRGAIARVRDYRAQLARRVQLGKAVTA